MQIAIITLQHAQRHLRFGRRAADNRVHRLLHLVQPGKCYAKADTVLVVGQRAQDAVEVDTDCGGDVLSKALDVLPKQNYNL